MNALGQHQQGIGLIEILITLVVISFGILAHVGLQRYTFHTATLASQRADAATLAQDKLEDLRGFSQLRNSNCEITYACIAGDTGGVLAADDTIKQGNATYSRHWDVQDYWYTASNSAPVTAKPTGDSLPDLKQVTIKIGWTDIDGETRTFELSSMIAAIDPAAASRIYQ